MKIKDIVWHVMVGLIIGFFTFALWSKQNGNEIETNDLSYLINFMLFNMQFFDISKIDKSSIRLRDKLKHYYVQSIIVGIVCFMLLASLLKIVPVESIVTSMPFLPLIILYTVSSVDALMFRCIKHYGIKALYVTSFTISILLLALLFFVFDLPLLFSFICANLIIVIIGFVFLLVHKKTNFKTATNTATY